MLHEEKNKSKTNEKLKSESLMLSSRETNKLKSSSHQQEYSKDNAVKEKQRKLLENCMHHTLSNQQNMLLHTMEHKQNFFPVRYRNGSSFLNIVDGQNVFIW